MIRISGDIALEELLRECLFSNDAHKEQLLALLRQEAGESGGDNGDGACCQLQNEAGASDELSEDELEMAAGGTKPPETESPSKREC